MLILSGFYITREWELLAVEPLRPTLPCGGGGGGGGGSTGQ